MLPWCCKWSCKNCGWDSAIWISVLGAQEVALDPEDLIKEDKKSLSFLFLRKYCMVPKSDGGCSKVFFSAFLSAYFTVSYCTPLPLEYFLPHCYWDKLPITKVATRKKKKSVFSITMQSGSFVIGSVVGMSLPPGPLPSWLSLFFVWDAPICVDSCDFLFQSLFMGCLFFPLQETEQPGGGKAVVSSIYWS